MPRKVLPDGQQIVFHIFLVFILCYTDSAVPQHDNCFTRCKKMTRGGNETYQCYLNISGGCRSINELVERKYSEGVRDRILKVTTALDATCTQVLGSPLINFTEVQILMPKIRSVSVTGCNISRNGLEGTLPSTVQTLNLSYNALESLPESLFQYSEGSSSELSVIDLRGNQNLTTIPESLLNLTSLKKIWLGSHRLSCSWAKNYLYSLYSRNNDIFMDAGKLNCISTRKQEADSVLSLTILGALKAKQAEETECGRIPQCSCRIDVIYRKKNQKDNLPVSFTDRGENISIILNVDCSSRNLTRLPEISPHTKILNVSNNQIKGLDELARSEYRNLRTLIAEHNLIEDISSIKGTEFAKHFDILYLAQNRITRLSKDVMSVLLNEDVKGPGKISLEENSVHCDCETAKVLLLLTKYKDKVRGVKNISCLNLPEKLYQLREQELCETEEPDSSNKEWWSVVIALEVCLILVVLAKVYYDSRQYRQTGILPWCSDKMPRLPCDFMLEGLKGTRVQR